MNVIILRQKKIFFWFLDHTKAIYYLFSPVRPLSPFGCLYFPISILSYKKKVKLLTCVWFMAVVALSEILWVFDDRNPGHTDHHGVWAGVQ